jgi:hypothetical protein
MIERPVDTTAGRWRRAGVLARRAGPFLAFAAGLAVPDASVRAGVATGSAVAAAQAVPRLSDGVMVLATGIDAIGQRISTWPDAEVEAALLVAFGLLLLYAASLVSRARRRRAPSPEAQPEARLVPFPPNAPSRPMR